MAGLLFFSEFASCISTLIGGSLITTLPRSKTLSRFLDSANAPLFSAFCIATTFLTYACMYGFRKPFTAGSFSDNEVMTVGYKAALVAAQLVGYTLSKFWGIKFTSEISPANRAMAILLLIGFAQLSLFGFAITPAPYNILFLFLNGLPLGVVFGLVLSFLEGRTVSEALVAGLCASFIFASGLSKSVGTQMLQWQVSEYWMPFCSGLVFLVPLLVAVWLMNHIPPPKFDDEMKRSKRTTMDGAMRSRFFRKHWLGLVVLCFVFALLTVIRGIRDDFSLEIFEAMNFQVDSSVFTRTELYVMVVVTVMAGMTFLIGNHRWAFLATIGLIGLGFLILLGSMWLRESGLISPFYYMVMFGIGVYIPYVLFHTTVFERLIAAYREKATVSYLMYVADAIGYLTLLLILAGKTIPYSKGVSLMTAMVGEAGYLYLLELITFYASITCIMLCVGLTWYFGKSLPKSNTFDLPVEVDSFQAKQLATLKS